jgi:Rrf2 family protein
MLVTQKCQYALRALFALAQHNDDRPLKIAVIAEEQEIPARFLEVILSQLKQGGFVESRRGTEGGYLLARPAAEIRVGDIVRFVDGPSQTEEAAHGQDVFALTWRRAAQAMHGVFDGLSVADLVAQDQVLRARWAPMYEI